MTELQQKLFEMLKFFHELCKKENLRYYLLGGTALGAARHQGFIPWDDDIDVGMPRADYEKLKKISETNDKGKYCFEFPSKEKDFTYAYGKMYDTTTTLIENTRYKTKRGIFIDIFPLDGAGNNKQESLRNFKKIDKKANLLYTATLAWRNGRNPYKNIALSLMQLIPINQAKLKLKIDKMASLIDYDSVEYIANFFGNWHEKEIAEKQWFGAPTEYTFEGIKVFGPENMDAYLTALYGDWRTPPPIEKQISHHDYLFLDLNLPYKKREI